jgi:hypothetical protein
MHHKAQGIARAYLEDEFISFHFIVDMASVRPFGYLAILLLTSPSSFPHTAVLTFF